MSWIIQSLLRSTVEIKTQQDIDSEDYNNLLIIEKKIKDMSSDGLLSSKDLEILEKVSDGKPLDEAGEQILKSRITLARKFYAICDRIAYALGGEFTDEGYLSSIQRKHHLTEEEVDKARKYIKGRFKYKIMRKL